MKDSKHKAEEYRLAPGATKQEKETDNADPSKPRDLKQWNDLVGQRIEEALRQGMFENLPGKGKRQNLQGNPHVPEGQGMAFDLLKNNDMAPAWIMDRKAVQADIQKLRLKLQRLSAVHHEGMAEENEALRQEWQQSWASYVESWRAEIATLNKRIEALNLYQPPIPSLEIFKLRLDEEINRAQSQ